MPILRNFLTAGALLAASLAPHANAHTWIEEMQMIDSNGTYTGDRGFSRGYMARTEPGFNGDSNLWMLPSLDARNPDETVRTRINGSDLMCHPAQRSSNYTNPAYPPLKATPGGFMAMKYLENGHVTLPWTLPGKPQNGGSVLVFGTTNPKAEEKIVDVMQWTEDGKGGDGRGFLMGQMDYDDGECHQLNTCWVSGERQILFPNRVPGQPDSSVERWCESNVKIPTDLPAGKKLTAYWIWDWGTVAGEDCLAPDGRDQYYTNCADLDIVAGDATSANGKMAADATAPALGQEDPNSRAVKNYASRSAVNKWTLVTAPNWADFNNNKAAATPTPAANSSWAAFCSTSILAQQSAAAADPAALPPSCPPGSYAPTGASYSAWSASVKAKATDMPADSPAPAPTTEAPAPTSAPEISAPATSAPAVPSSPAPPASAPSQAASGAVVTVTETQISISTMTTYVASSAASSAPANSAPAPPASAPAPSVAAEAPSAPAPPAGGPSNAGGYPTVSMINNPSAGMAAPTGPPQAGGAPPYAVGTGPNGMGSEHPAPPTRRHARQFAA